MAKYTCDSGALILANYIKFDRLNDINNVVFGNVELPKSIDIYIDLYSVTFGLLKGTYDMSLDKSKLDISAHIINMVAHYRRFYRSNNIDTRFFLIFSANCSYSCAKLVPEWNTKDTFYYNSPEWHHLMDNLNALNEVFKYCSNVLFINTSYEVSTVMYDIMLQEENFANTKIIITKDILTMQLLALVPNSIVFRPKKYKKEDVSYFISSLNNGLYTHLVNKRKVQFTFDNDQQEIFSSGLYSFVLAATSLPERGLKNIISLPVILKTLQWVVQKPDILNGYNNDIMKLVDAFPYKDRARLIHNNIENRFKAVDTIFQRSIYYYSTEKVTNNTSFMNLYDPEGIHNIDSTYYDKCHLNLEYL